MEKVRIFIIHEPGLAFRWVSELIMCYLLLKVELNKLYVDKLVFILLLNAIRNLMENVSTYFIHVLGLA